MRCEAAYPYKALSFRQVRNIANCRDCWQTVRDAGIVSVAIVLKHAYIFGEHEEAVGELARELGFTQVWLRAPRLGPHRSVRSSVNHNSGMAPFQVEVLSQHLSDLLAQ